MHMVFVWCRRETENNKIFSYVNPFSSQIHQISPYANKIYIHKYQKYFVVEELA